MTTEKIEVKPFNPRLRSGGWARWLPGFATARAYRLEWLLKDLTAGIVLTTLMVPAGMAYANAAGLPAIYGLYASIVPLIAYAIFGPSRILVVAPDSALSGLIAATILPLAAGQTDRAVALAGMISILAGGLCLVAGFARFGFITDLLSKPIRFGYMNGIALIVIISQLPKILGFKIKGDGIIAELNQIVRGAIDGKTNLTALLIGVSCLVVMAAFKRWLPKIPGVMIAVIGATAVSSLMELSAKHGVTVVGALPQGLPAFRFPMISLEDVKAIFPGAVAIALVSYADLSVLSRAYAMRGGAIADSNQELLALGAANISAGLFQGFPVSSSTSRTPVAEAAGAQTQLTGVVAALCVALMLLFAPALMKDLPLAALGAVVIFACVRVVEVRAVWRLYHYRKIEFVSFLVCFFGVVFFGVIQGVFVAVGLALLAVLWRAWRPYHAVLGRVDGLKGYHDITRYPHARRIPGLVLFRWDAPLFFANAQTFHDSVLRAIANAPTPTKWVVVAAEPVTDVDVTAADAIAELDQTLHESGMDLCFAEMKDPVKDHLKRYGLFIKLGEDNFFPTLGQAVDRFLDTHKVAWRDWDEEKKVDVKLTQ